MSSFDFVVIGGGSAGYFAAESAGRLGVNTVCVEGAEELGGFEQLLEMADPQLFAWVTGQADVPRNLDTALFRRLRDFNRQGCGAR